MGRVETRSSLRPRWPQLSKLKQLKLREYSTELLKKTLVVLALVMEKGKKKMRMETDRQPRQTKLTKMPRLRTQMNPRFRCKLANSRC